MKTVFDIFSTREIIYRQDEHHDNIYVIVSLIKDTRLPDSFRKIYSKYDLVMVQVDTPMMRD